jgi:hypothetical protein
MPQYQRLISVDVQPSDALPCGWHAEIVGDFITVVEHNAANDLVRELQRCYSLDNDGQRTSRRTKGCRLTHL